MATPIPSFFKIRLVALILGFFLMFFLVGLVRFCFAHVGEHAACEVRNVVVYNQQTSNWIHYWFDKTIAMFRADTGITHLNESGAYYSGEIWCTEDCSLFTEHNSLDIWMTDHDFENGGGGGEGEGYGTCLNCEDKIPPLAAQCPYGLNNYFCETEFGEPQGGCLVNDCDDVPPSAYDDICIPENEGDYRRESCVMVDGVPQPSAECGNCNDDREAWGNAHCGGSQYIETYDCETNTGTCRDHNCQDLESDCYDQCQGQIALWTCDPETLAKTCTCQESLSYDNTPTPPSDYDGSTPDGSRSDPADTDSDSQKKTTDNTADTVKNTAKTNEILSKELTKISKNTAETNSKLSETNKLLSEIKSQNSADSIVNGITGADSTGKGGKSLKDLEGTLEALAVDVNNINNGTFTKETITNDFELSDNSTGQFGDRFNTFISDLKETPLFSLPNQVLFNIPNSSESTLTIDMGRYGQQQVDFSDYATPLLILRSAFLICFAFAGIRIVVSKK